MIELLGKFESVMEDYIMANFIEELYYGNIESQNMKEFIGTKGRISLVLKEMRANDREEGDLITLYNGESGEYRIINNDSQYKDMYGQVCTLIDMIENNTEGNPTIESVFSAFKTACLAQEAIEKNTIIRL